MLIHEILKQYWGYDKFRPLQEDIINATLAGNDTLALLPTGGGKSICFQVPALAKDGLCLVISPLIALMKDQVEQLQQRNISAAAIYSGMSMREQMLTLENAQNGAYKFLYLSPERLKSTKFKDRLPYLNCTLLAIDEAHCISQWGYDFRPEYLMIAEARELLPNVPVLALTASATQQVVIDIQEKLGFKKHNVFSKSFTRDNLSYVVNYTEQKLERMVHILKRVNGSGLVYVRNRKQTQDLSTYLRRNNIVADFYHAGLPHAIRAQKQEDWIKDKTRIIVCTNAFGMGIDKPNVRVVVHYEMPESLESYYQEAGRAGRDGNKAYCVLLHHEGDESTAQHKLSLAFPPEEEIKRVYQALCNYYSLPIGANLDRSFDFDMAEFVQRFNLSVQVVYPALKLLQQCDLIALTESFFEPSKFKFIVNHEVLYKFQVENEKYDDMIKVLLRSYGGMFDNYVRINEQQIAKRIKIDEQVFTKFLIQLNKLGLADYQPQKDKPQITFTTQRVAAELIDLRKALLQQRKQVAYQKLEAMIGYANNIHRCRSKIIVEYFNEFGSEDCGICDVCLNNQSNEVKTEAAKLIENRIMELLAKNAMHVTNLVKAIPEHKPEKITTIIRYLLDNDKLRYNNQHQLIWHNSN
ncbi:MAG: RecQ family ATP-dependent DNA helicase [Bacteroidia bacterium]|nr:RecQ family ATP-dependent DNA helicase [Bacteroidia bacterium]MBP9689518.1 RecQ family ATP-dependent DNA helicase [Bacteroidia bacterium]